MTEISRPPTQLKPVKPPPTGHTVHTSASHPRDLHKLRQALNHHAWNPQPSSQANSLASSRNPSRKTFYQPSDSSRQSTSHRLSGSEFDNDLEFHTVEALTHTPDTSPSKNSYTFHSQRAPSVGVDSSDSGIHFPSITPHSTRNTRQRSSSHGSREVYHSTFSKHRKNGHWSSTKQFEFRTEKTLSSILHEMHKSLVELNISCTNSDQKTQTLYLRYQNINFQVHVDKDHLNTCQLHFQWLKGGSQERYEDLCSKIFHSFH